MTSLAVVIVLLLTMALASYIDRRPENRYVPGVWEQRIYGGIVVEYTVREGHIVFAQAREVGSARMQLGWLAGYGPC